MECMYVKILSSGNQKLIDVANEIFRKYPESIGNDLPSLVKYIIENNITDERVYLCCIASIKLNKPKKLKLLLSRQKELGLIISSEDYIKACFESYNMESLKVLLEFGICSNEDIEKLSNDDKYKYISTQRINEKLDCDISQILKWRGSNEICKSGIYRDKLIECCISCIKLDRLDDLELLYVKERERRGLDWFRRIDEKLIVTCFEYDNVEALKLLLETCRDYDDYVDMDYYMCRSDKMLDYVLTVVRKIYLRRADIKYIIKNDTFHIYNKDSVDVRKDVMLKGRKYAIKYGKNEIVKHIDSIYPPEDNV